jgi:hypothetical protein
MTFYRIGNKQRQIIEAMKAGASLEQNGWGFFYLVRDGVRERVSDQSCQGLHHRGLIAVAKKEEHPGYLGGAHTWYELTEQGKAAIG